MDYTVINQYSNEAEAYLDKGFLINNGIAAEVESNAMSDIFPAPGAGTGSIFLLVPEKDAAEAEKLLANRPQ